MGIEEQKIKFLEIIQGIINRIASNSFSLKQWTVSLLVGVFVLCEKSANRAFLIIAYFPILFFWLLDSYYLQQERLYRKVYDEKQGHSTIDYTIIKPKPKRVDKTLYIQCIVSIAELLFYMSLAAAVALLSLILNNNFR